MLLIFVLTCLLKKIAPYQKQTFSLIQHNKIIKIANISS